MLDHQTLIDQYLAKGGAVTICPPKAADGAVPVTRKDRPLRPMWIRPKGQ